MKTIFALLLSPAAALAAVVRPPAENPQQDLRRPEQKLEQQPAVPRVVVVTRIEHQLVQLPRAAGAARTTQTNTITLTCDHTWCNEQGISMCVYWAGITGYDPARGPVPGAVATSLGTCVNPKETAAEVTATAFPAAD